MITIWVPYRQDNYLLVRYRDFTPANTKMNISWYLLPNKRRSIATRLNSAMPQKTVILGLFLNRLNKYQVITEDSKPWVYSVSVICQYNKRFIFAFITVCLIGDHLLLLRYYRPYVIIFMMCVLLYNSCHMAIICR